MSSSKQPKGKEASEKLQADLIEKMRLKKEARKVKKNEQLSKRDEKISEYYDDCEDVSAIIEKLKYKSPAISFFVEKIYYYATEDARGKTLKAKAQIRYCMSQSKKDAVNKSIEYLKVDISTAIGILKSFKTVIVFK